MNEYRVNKRSFGTSFLALFMLSLASEFIWPHKSSPSDFLLYKIFYDPSIKIKFHWSRVKSNFLAPTQTPNSNDFWQMFNYYCLINANTTTHIKSANFTSSNDDEEKVGRKELQKNQKTFTISICSSSINFVQHPSSCAFSNSSCVFIDCCYTMFAYKCFKAVAAAAMKIKHSHLSLRHDTPLTFSR